MKYMMLLRKGISVPVAPVLKGQPVIPLSGILRAFLSTIFA